MKKLVNYDSKMENNLSKMIDNIDKLQTILKKLSDKSWQDKIFLIVITCL